MFNLHFHMQHCVTALYNDTEHSTYCSVLYSLQNAIQAPKKEKFTILSSIFKWIRYHKCAYITSYSYRNLLIIYYNITNISFQTYLSFSLTALCNGKLDQKNDSSRFRLIIILPVPYFIVWYY